MRCPILYEINTRCWLRELSEQHARPVALDSVPHDQFERWQRLGFTHIWLMGVWTGGPLARACAAEPVQTSHYAHVLPDLQDRDIAASPYAIAKYEVPAELGGDAGLAVFRSLLNVRGLKLMLDFVPNHLGLDHEWVRSRPEFFVQGSESLPGCFVPDLARPMRYLAHARDPFFAPWSDTVQVDYRREDARQAMRELLQSVAQRCDGVRCDMAMLLLNDVFCKTWERFPCASPAPAGEFWSDAISQVKRAFRDFLFLAEVYWKLESELQALGFDFTYDKELYDRLAARDGPGVQRHLLGMPPEVLAASAHFLENHDEQRAAAVWTLPEHCAAAALVLSLPGMRFLHEGQLAGARIRVPVQLLRRPHEPADPEIANFYETLLRLLPQTAIGRGQFRLLQSQPARPNDTSHERIILIQWQSDPSAFDLVAVNLSSTAALIHAPVQPEEGKRAYELRELLPGTQREYEPVASSHNLELSLAPCAFKILHLRAESR